MSALLPKAGHHLSPGPRVDILAASAMGFNRRKMEDQRREAAEKEAATRRATDAQVLEDAERLIAAWNERQAMRAPMIFSPTIGAAIKAGYWFLWVRCPACRISSLGKVDYGARKQEFGLIICSETQPG